MVAELERKAAFTWQTYTYRHYDAKSEEEFKRWVVLHDWLEVYEADGPEAKAEAYQNTISEATARCFPLRTTRKKSTDLRWMSRGGLKEIRRRKSIFMAKGGDRTAAWKEQKKLTMSLILKRKRGFLDRQKEHILAEDANRIEFFKNMLGISLNLKNPSNLM